MTRKSFIVIVVLSTIVTYVIAIVDAFARNSLIGGSAGLPFKFAHGYFGSSNTNYLLLLSDIAFWFIVVWLIWKLLRQSSKKKK